MPRIRKSLFPLSDEQKQKLEAFEQRIAGDTEWIRAYCQRLQRDQGLSTDAILAALKDAGISADPQKVSLWLGEAVHQNGRKARVAS
ncbi:MAG: hypothetical protein WAN59_10730 [Candidatus Baltobacteraceae bacterium]